MPDVKTAKAYTDDFPLSKAGLLEWSFIALQIPLPIETLFREGVYLNPPYDRTLRPAQGGVAMKHAFGIAVPETLAEICTPSSCALLIYDMQVGIVPQISEGQEILDRCIRLLDAAGRGGFRVFFTRHFYLPNQAAGSGQLRRAMVWQRKDDPADTTPFIPQGSKRWEIVPELGPREGEVIIDKITMSAFEGTFLNLAMRDAHLEAFIIPGTALEVGIEPTVRHGADLNYVPVVVVDACGACRDISRERTAPYRCCPQFHAR